MSSAQRRQHLLGVAREVFARDGYRSATALEVGTQAGVSETLVLKHFGTKEAMFRAAVADPLLHLLEAQNAQTRALLEAGEMEDVPGQMDQVEAFLSTWATLLKEQGPALYALLTELRDFPDITERLVAALQAQVEEIIRLARPHVDAGGYRPFNLRVSTYAALGAVTVGAIVWDDPVEFVHEFMKIFSHGVLAEPAGPRRERPQQPAGTTPAARR